MAGVTPNPYEHIEEKLLKLVQQGNREVFPFWMRLITTDDLDEKAQVVQDLRDHINQVFQEFARLVGEDPR